MAVHGGGLLIHSSYTTPRDTTLTGWDTVFVNNSGAREFWSGTWSFEKLSDDTFRLSSTLNGESHRSTFRIFDHDHIQNVGNNYMVVRAR